MCITRRALTCSTSNYWMEQFGAADWFAAASARQSRAQGVDISACRVLLPPEKCGARVTAADGWFS